MRILNRGLIFVLAVVVVAVAPVATVHPGAFHPPCVEPEAGAEDRTMTDTVPTDPFVYRFFEIMQVYGMAMKDVAQEEFGDGIMSAIDFSIDVDREADPKGDRVKITYSGKFLPYKQF